MPFKKWSARSTPLFPFRDNKIYILTFNDKKLAKEIGKRVQGKLVYGNYIPKKTEVQCKTYSYPARSPNEGGFPERVPAVFERRLTSNSMSKSKSKFKHERRDTF